MRLIWLVSAPESSRSVARAIVATVTDVEVHQLWLHQVACIHGESAGRRSVYSGHEAGRTVGHRATSAVGSSEEMLCCIGHLRSPGSTHIEAARDCNKGSRPLLHTQPVPSLPVGSAGLTRRRPAARRSVPSICYAREKFALIGKVRVGFLGQW